MIPCAQEAATPKKARAEYSEKRRSSIGHNAPFIVVVLWISAACIVPALTPEVIGLFHDDALYALNGRELASGHAYRLANLPTAPFQTKYPPLYPAALALVWRIWSEFPANVVALKSVVLPFVAVALLATWKLATSLRDRSLGLLATALVPLNPAVVGLSDYTLTDIPYMGLSTALIAWWVGRQDRSVRTAVPGAALAALLPLTRTIGVAAGVVFLIEAARKRRADALLVAISVFASFGAWEAWRLLQGQPTDGLLRYYTSYEPSALTYLTTDRRLAFAIISGNAWHALVSIPWLMGPGWLILPFLWTGLAIVGFGLLGDRGRFIQVHVVVYVALILLHPFAPYRYVIPLIPIIGICALLGVRALWVPVSRWLAIQSSRRDFEPALVVATAVLIAGNVGYYSARLSAGHHRLPGWLVTDMGYGWEGFSETFTWVRQHTPPHAIIGSVFDPMYALYTGRQAVRPWSHRPETYFYPVGQEQPFVGHSTEIAPRLARIGITHIILDPPSGYVEGPAAIELLRGVMATSGVESRRVFVSTDGNHEVFEVRWPAEWTSDPAERGAQSKSNRAK